MNNINHPLSYEDWCCYRIMANTPSNRKEYGEYLKRVEKSKKKSDYCGEMGKSRGCNEQMN